MVKRKYFKKFFAVTLATLTLMSTINLQGVVAKATDDVTVVEQTVAEQKDAAADVTDGSTENTTDDNGQSDERDNITYDKAYGYIDNGYVAPRLDVTESNDGLCQSTAIPAKYDSRDYGYVTPVRNQGSWGTCWAFAAIAAMESTALSHGVANDASALDMSEYNVVYMANDDRTFVDPLGGTDGDNTFTDDMTSALRMGGNQTMVFRAMSKWAGMVGESDCAYPGALATIYKYDASKLQYILTGVRQVNMADRDYVKKAVMENGAASVYYYDADAYARFEYYYNYKVKGTNHAVTIVGWDDTVSKENFKTTDSDGVTHMPEGDGAWLIKNSWGQYNYRTVDGYMWISYYDLSVNTGNATYYEVAKAGTYDYNYQYDGNTELGFGLTLSTGDYILADKYANVFTVKEGTGSQKLDAVAFGVKDANTSYSIQIYKNPTLNTEDEDGTLSGTTDNPESGTPLLATPVTGKTTFAGYYTVNLPNTIKLNEGDTFAVVITFADKTSMDYSYTYINPTGYTSVSHNNESYYAPSGTLVDMYEYYATKNYNVNMCIKAFTSKVSDNLTIPQLTGVTADDDNNVQVVWQNVDGAEGYEIFRGSEANGTFTLLSDVTDNSFIDNTVKCGNKYYYKVRAYKTSSGAKVYSDYSSAQAIFIDIPTTTLSISNDDENVTLSWDKVNGAVKYNIFKSYDNINFEKIKTLTDNTYTESVEYNTKVYYYVTLEMILDNEISESMKSNTIEAYIKTKAPAVSADSTSYGKVRLSWKATSGSEIYRLYLYNEETKAYEILKDIKNTEVLEYVDDNLESVEGTTRKYMITSYTVKDGVMTAGETTYVNAFVRHPALKNLAYTLENGVLTITWDEYDGVIGRYGMYSIYSSTTPNGEYKLLMNKHTNKYMIYNYDDSKSLYIKVVAHGSITGKDEAFGNYYDKITAMQDVPLKIQGQEKELTATLQSEDSTEAVTKQLGSKIKLDVTASGGSESYTYKFAVLNVDTGKWSVLRDFSESNTYTYALNYTGTKQFAVTVKDSDGNTVATNRLSVKVVSPQNKLSAALSINNSTQAITKELGSSIQLNVTASGGSGTYTYKYVVHNLETDSWYTLKDYNSSSSYNVKLSSIGKKEFVVSVKDSNGNVAATRRIGVTCVKSAFNATLSITGIDDNQTAYVGDSIRLNVTATGGNGTYTYKYVVHNLETDSWYTLKDYNSASSYTTKLSSSGKKEFVVSVKDSSGNIVSTTRIQVTVKK